jgi:hypothetical protein
LVERLRNIMVRLQGSLWPMPTGIGAAAFLLAYGLLRFGPTLAGMTGQL